MIGHSSGANAALRMAETHAVAGLVLLGAGYTKDDYTQDAANRAASAAAGLEPGRWCKRGKFDYHAYDVFWRLTFQDVVFYPYPKTHAAGWVVFQ